MPGPLEGVRVVEVASFVFVPAAAAILADWGAEVIKVERPEWGDPVREVSAWGVPARVNGVGHLFEVTNRGKRAIGIDVNTPEGRDILMSLVDTADVFLTNLLPAARTKLGIEPGRHPGAQPAHRLRAGHGAGATRPARRQGRLRRDHLLGALRGGGRRHAGGVRVPVADARSGLRRPAVRHGTRRRHRCRPVPARAHRQGDGGRRVADVGRAVGDGDDRLRVASVLDVDELPAPDRTKTANPLTNVYRTKDGHFVALGFLQADRYWTELCILVDRLDWIVDERFDTMQSRAANSEACVKMLDELFAERTLAEWEELLSRQQGQWDVFLKAGEVRYDEQVQANEFAQLVQHDGDGKVVLVPAPAQFGGEVSQLGRGPALGADTDALLAELGYDDDDGRRPPQSQRGG